MVGGRLEVEDGKFFFLLPDVFICFWLSNERMRGKGRFFVWNHGMG